MRVKDLQEFLSNFTQSNAVGRQGNAISNAVIDANELLVFIPAVPLTVLI